MEEKTTSNEGSRFCTHCSFCGHPRDETMLMIGPRVSICPDCVITATRAFITAGTSRMFHIACGRPPDPSKSWDDVEVVE